MAIMLTRKPIPLPGWHLVDQAAMLEALGELSELGWRGAVSRSGDTWRIEVNKVTPPVQAALGDWLVLDGTLTAMSDADCGDGYDVAEGGS